MRDRLGISVSEYFDEVQDAMPVELEALEEWGVGQRLLEGVLAGAELRACMQAEIARGALPPGELARPPLARIGAVVGQLADAARTLTDGTPGSLDVTVALPDGRTLAGTVTGVCGDAVRAISYSRVRPRDRLRGWVRLLALSAAYPDRRSESVVIGRARAGVRGAGVTVARIPALGADPPARRQAALEHLGVLLDLYDRGMREPLPLACETSAAYAEAVAAGGHAESAARGAWETVFRYEKEDRQPEHLLVHGDAVPLAALLAEAPRDDERGPGWDEDETTRFGRYAVRLWRGLLSLRGAERPMSVTQAYTEFDLCGPLPSGVTVLEASAGTGKTYAIAALTARYVAEGTPLDRLLLITFTRIATGELRDRVRERLVWCEQQLTTILAGAPDLVPTHPDPVVTLLAGGPREEVARRRDRLARAVADFDAATIATTHGFCQEVLAELGTIGDLDRETEFVEDVSDLLEETLDDLYVRRFGPRTAGTARFTRAEALQIARAAVFNPTAQLEPSGEPDDSTAAMRYRLAFRVRRDLEQRKRSLAIMTYDDLLTRLRDILGGPNAAAAKERLRARYGVVLVDEFQDTDPIQWQILSRAFASAGVTLVLVADPKQAIYAFRGAEVYAYLVAAAQAHDHATLAVNRRSDQPLLDAFDALFADARLGHEGIVYRQLRAAPAHQTSRLRAAPEGAALRIRVVHRSDPTIEQTNYGYARAPSARQHVARDLAADVVRLLDSGATLEHRSPDGEPIGEEVICPRHVAVLVRTHANAELVRVQLTAARVPAVINGGGNVFATTTARAWLRLLEALERPASTVRARTAAATPFLGWSGERIATAGEADWEEVHRRLHRWSRILRDSGVAALMESITVSEDLAARLLAYTAGERQLTDLGHLAQLLHRAASAERLGVTALRGWLAERIADAGREDPEDERTRRLESDAEAVQVLTIHRSKGLEFPVVYCPFLWEPSYIPRDPEPVFFHDPGAGFRRTIDVGLDGRAWDAHVRRHRDEQRGEDLRLAYVALTRAKHQAVMWWAGSYDSRHSPLGRLLFAKGTDGTIAPEGRSTPSDEVADQRFAELAAQAPGAISAERSTLGMPTTWSPPAEAPIELAAARFDRQLDLWWRRTSYTDITSDAHDPVVMSEPERPVLTDEPSSPTPVTASSEAREGVTPPALARESPMAEMPVGTEFGTFVHSVLEATDFAVPDLDAELAAHVAMSATRRVVDLGDPSALVAGLRAAIETPLGPLVDGKRLRDISRRDRLDELEFELRWRAATSPVGASRCRPSRTCCGRGCRPRIRWRRTRRGSRIRRFVGRARGFLTGSIDLVIRLDGPRFAIADYKTNWLGPVDEPLTLAHYQPVALTAEMSRAHYGLQALLYTVALHRYLRWRLPAYEPDRHLAGVVYLFVRGMAGEPGAGVFAWRPPGPLLDSLSDVLDGRTV